MSTEVTPARTAAAGEAPRRRPALWKVALGFLAVCVWVLWRTGPGKIPNVEIFETIARGWPTIPMGPTTAYVLRVPLGQIAYHLLPREGTGTFLALHLACLVGTGALLLAWMCSRLGARAGLVAGGIVTLAPVTAVLLLWIGMYDAFSVLTWVVLLVTLSRRGHWQFAAAALAGFQDFEQVVVGLFMLLLVPRLSRQVGLRPRGAWLLPGVVVGKVVLELYLKHVGATPGSRLSFLSDLGVLEHLVGTTASNGPLVLWSALGGLWGFALTALVQLWSRWSVREKVQLALAFGGWLFSSAITADHSRVLAITAFPLIVLGAMAIADRWRDLGELARLPQTWLMVLAPPLIVFDSITLPMGVKLHLWHVWIF
jgi:hypothetical protein